MGTGAAPALISVSSFSFSSERSSSFSASSSNIARRSRPASRSAGRALIPNRAPVNAPQIMVIVSAFPPQDAAAASRSAGA